MPRIPIIHGGTNIDTGDPYLIVSEAKPIVDYILSIHSEDDAPDQEQIQLLTQAVESEIARTGSIVITKRVGMLIARGLADHV